MPTRRDGASVPKLALALTGLGAFLVSLDVSVANAVLPALAESFEGESRQALAWVITVYAIVFAAALVPAGRLADRGGRRRVFCLGLAVFGAGSLVCGAAGSLPVLLAGRILQGVGAAAAQPASVGLLLAAVPPGQRALYTARWFGAGSLGIALGPLVGGVAADQLDWRAAFLINIPLVVWALALTPRVLPETARHPGRRLPDPLGALVLAGSAAAVTLGVSQLGDWGAGDARTLTALAAGGLLAAWLVRRCRALPDPLLQLEMLRAPQFARVTIATVSYSAGFFGLLLTFVQFLTSVWGMSITAAGLAISPMPLLVVPLSRHVGRLPARFGFAAPLASGATLIAVALVLEVLTADGASFEASWMPGMLIAGVGIGLCYPLLGAAAVAGLSPADLAAATAINQCARQLGATFGVAITVAVLGPAANPTVDRFHVAWLACAVLCLVAAAAAWSVGRAPCRDTASAGASRLPVIPILNGDAADV